MSFYPLEYSFRSLIAAPVSPNTSASFRTTPPQLYILCLKLPDKFSALYFRSLDSVDLGFQQKYLEAVGYYKEYSSSFCFTLYPFFCKLGVSRIHMFNSNKVREKNLGVNRLMVIYDTKSSVINVMDDKKHNHVTEASFIFM